MTAQHLDGLSFAISIDSRHHPYNSADMGRLRKPRILRLYLGDDLASRGLVVLAEAAADTSKEEETQRDQRDSAHNRRVNEQQHRLEMTSVT